MDDTPFETLVNIQSYSDEELHELADRLSAEEREISKRRRLLHGEIDIVRAEIVRRLREKHSAGRLAGGATAMCARSPTSSAAKRVASSQTPNK